MGELGMIVDVSHLSEGGFFDVAEAVKGPLPRRTPAPAHCAGTAATSPTGSCVSLATTAACAG